MIVAEFVPVVNGVPLGITVQLYVLPVWNDVEYVAVLLEQTEAEPATDGVGNGLIDTVAVAVALHWVAVIVSITWIEPDVLFDQVTLTLLVPKPLVIEPPFTVQV